MSEFTEKENERSCQKKLAPPRSIRDAGGKTQIVWDMIAKRYPKAAPLLCEMETAIDRAETLLHQLRRVPYENDIVTNIRVSPTPSKGSHSTEASYSEESERQRSEASIQELSSTSDDTTGEVEEVGTRISYDRIPEMEDPSGSTSSASVEKFDEKESKNPRPHVRANDELKNPESPEPGNKSQKLQLHKQPVSASYDEKRDLPTTKEVESLEGWERVVGGEMTKPKKAHTKREVSIGRYENKTNRQNTKSAVLAVEKSTKTREEKGTVSAITNETIEPELVKVKKNRKPETVESPKRRAKITSDSSPNRNPTTNSGSLSIPTETERIKIEDKHEKENITERKTAVEILDVYAVENKKEVNFKVLQENPNSCKMECYFADIKAEHFGPSESVVRNELAMIILRMMAERQMDEQDMGNLTTFSDDQMRDIIAFCTDGKPENAMRRLYKICLEKNAPKPIYKVRQSNGVKGLRNSAECRALGEVGHGSQIREETAKIQAAEEVLKKLYLQLTP